LGRGHCAWSTTGKRGLIEGAHIWGNEWMDIEFGNSQKNKETRKRKCEENRVIKRERKGFVFPWLREEFKDEPMRMGRWEEIEI